MIGRGEAEPHQLAALHVAPARADAAASAAAAPRRRAAGCRNREVRRRRVHRRRSAALVRWRALAGMPRPRRLNSRHRLLGCGQATEKASKSYEISPWPSSTFTNFPAFPTITACSIHDADAALTAAIDAPDAEAVAAALKEKGWRLTHILTTHHHGDHTDGNLALKAETKLHHHRPARGGGQGPGHRQAGGRGRHLQVRRPRGARARYARPHRRPHLLLDALGRRGLRRRHAVRHRLRPRHRGQRRR